MWLCLERCWVAKKWFFRNHSNCDPDFSRMTVSMGWDVLKLQELFLWKKSIQNMMRTTSNFWKHTWEITTAQRHGTGTLQGQSRRNALNQLRIQHCPPLHEKGLLIVVRNNNGGFTTYENHTEFKQCYTLYPTVNCNNWMLGTAAVPVYTHHLVAGTANITSKFVTLFVLLPYSFSSLILLSLLILLAVTLSRLVMLLILYFLCQIFLGDQFPVRQLSLLAHSSLCSMPTLFSIFIIFGKF